MVAMKSDLRQTALYREAEALCSELRKPGTGQICDAVEVHVSPSCEHVVFAGTIMERLEGAPPTRICLTNLATGDTRVLTFGPNTDRFPKYSPAGQQVAFLSDRHQAGDFQLYLLDPRSGTALPTKRVDGWVEYLHWSPDGKQILLGVAGYGADVSGRQGAVSSNRAAVDAPSWMPAVDTGDESHRWRRAWVYELARDQVRQVSPAEANIWEAVWCGNEAIAVVVSLGPGEGLWYSARLSIIEIEGSNSRELYTPKHQLGWPAASPSGEHLAIVEAFCSDRWSVAGELRLIDTASGWGRVINTLGVDITYAEWRSNSKLLLAGHRGFETVVGLYELASDLFTQVWASEDISTSDYIRVSGMKSAGDCVLIGESFLRAPELAVIQEGRYRPVRSFDLGYGEVVKVMQAIERVTWQAGDGLQIQGWLLRPQGNGPHPLVMHVHGGPVTHWRPAWLGRKGIFSLMLLKQGYAMFLPNPRGSNGRGQDYAYRVRGDLGGADAQDLLSGLDVLVEQGVADPKRLGVMGVSYGGFMTSWLITQDARFAAAVPVAPHTNQVTEHLLSNIPHFVDLFLADKYSNPSGKYFERSPIMHAQKVKTPTLNICGALDRCTPPEEAMQFHSAQLENGVESVLIIYPEEGHGIRKFPAAIDYAARLVAWFEKHMAAK